MNQEYIVDKGLSKIVGYKKSSKSISFEDISVIFSTLKEYREYAIPDSNSWNEYILDVFRILSFNTKIIKEGCFSIVENHSQKPPNIIIILTNSNIEEIEKLKNVIEQMSSLTENNDFSWAIVTDGFTINVVNLPATTQKDFCLYANLEKIIQDQRIDSFLTLYTTLQNIQVSRIRTDPNIGSFTSNRIDDEPTNPNARFPTISMLSLYKKKFENLRVNKNSKIWKEATNFSAPHKPVLLLSVLDIFDKNKNLPYVFEINGELKDGFDKYWNAVLPDQPLGNIVLPFFYLQGDGIWKLRVKAVEEENFRSIPEIDSLTMLNRLTDGARMHEEIFYFLKDDDYRTTLKLCLIEKYFSQELHTRLFRLANLDSTKIFKSQYLLENLRQEFEKHNGLFQGFIELPDPPSFIIEWGVPTLEACKNRDYLSMEAFTNLARSFGRSRSYACSDFGGEFGHWYTLPERQTRVYKTGRLYKYVLIFAVEDYFKEEGFEWK